MNVHRRDPFDEMRRENKKEIDDLDSYTLEEYKELVLELKERQVVLERENQELKKRDSKSQIPSLYRTLYNYSPHGMLLINREMYIQEINLAIEKSLGVKRESLLFHPLTHFIGTDDHPIFYQTLERVIDHEEERSCELNMWRDDTTFTARIHITLLPGQDNLLSISMVDVSHHKERERELQEELQQLNSFFDKLHIGLNIIDDSLKYIKVNQLAAKNIGRSVEEIEGKTIYEVVPAFAQKIEGSFKRILETKKEEKSIEVVGSLPGRREERVYWNSTHFPFTLANGRPGIGVVAMDITARKKAEERLKEAQELTEMILEFQPDATMVIHRDGQVLTWNKAMEALTGIPKEEMLGRREYIYAIPFFGEPQPLLANLLLEPEEEIEKWRGRYEIFYASEGKLYGEFYAREVYGGEGAYLWASASKIHNSKGEVIGAIESYRDITAQRQAKELVTSHNRFLTILESIDALVYVIDMETYEILYMNTSTKKIFGDREGEICWKVIHEEEGGPCSICSMDELLKRDGTPKGIYTAEKFEPKNNCWYQRRLQAIRWIDGRMVSLELATDITRRKEAEEALKKSDTRFRKFLEGFQGVAYQLNQIEEGSLYFRPTLFYGLVEEITGYRAHDFLEGYINWHDLIYPEDIDRFKAESMKLYTEEDYVADNEYRILHGDGSIRWIRDIAKRVDLDESLTIQGTLYDITRQRKTEERLQETLSKLQALLHNSPNNISIFDKDGRYIIVSRAVANLLGLPEEKIIGKTFYELLPPSIAEDFMETIALIQKRQENIVKTDRIPGVEDERIFETWLFPVEKKEGVIELIGAISLDITERLKTEKALLESESRFRQMADSIEEVFWLFSVKTNGFLYISPAYEKIWGRPREELMEDFYPTLRKTIYEEDRPLLREALKRLNHGKPIDLEFRIVRPEEEISWIHTRSFFVYDEEGEIIRVAGISMDITKLKESQERALEASKAKSEFLSRVSHELRTPLHAILSYADLGLEESRDQELEELEQYLQTISICGHRLARLIEDLLDISKIESGELRYDFQEEDASYLIRTFKKELMEILRDKEILLKIHPPSTPLKIYVDRDRLFQVIRNIVENAYKFSPSHHQITISFERREDPLPMVAITIMDEGPGIPEEYLERIFDKFYQVNRRNLKKEGTGLGLSICREIIRAHGGAIYAKNTKERGAAITFTLPLKGEHPSSPGDRDD